MRKFGIGVVVLALVGAVLGVLPGVAQADPPTVTNSAPATAPGAPTIVRNALARDASAIVSWTPPASTGGSAITGYAVTPYIGYFPLLPVAFNSTNTSQVVSGLTNGITYRFKVAAINAVGTGPTSKVTNPVVPGVLLQVGSVFDGQSLCFAGGFASKVMTAVETATGLSLWRKNVSVGNTAWHDLATTAATRLHPYGGVALTTSLVMNGGQSDLWAGESGAQVYAEEVAYADAARAAGFDVVIAVTISPGYYDTAQEAARIEHNRLLLADASGGFDAVVDVATLPELTDPTNLTYYDAIGIHWTAAGAQVAADAVAPVLQAKLGL